MRIRAESKNVLWEWFGLLVLLGLATVISEHLAPTQIMTDLIVYTVVVFAVPIAALRATWGSGSFWRNVVLLLVLHLLIASVIAYSVPTWSNGVPGLFIVAAGIIESLFLAGVLSRGRPKTS
jgi:hypothetical protein